MDYLDMSPKELRLEADRRELVQRHLEISERRAARDVIADAIVAIPKEAVNKGVSRTFLKNILDNLVATNEHEPMPTNGDISMCSSGMDVNWWQEEIAHHPRNDPESTLNRYKSRRLRLWE